MIRFDNYHKRFAEHLVLAIPALKLDSGIYWLKGENGSGKTTLIRSIAGLIPFDGDISVDDKDIRKQRGEYKGIVNYAEAEPLYPGFLSGDDLIRFYTKAKSGNGQQVKMLTDALGIASYSANKIGTYSSGMAKKLSLVLAFIGTPKLILLDEPLITLDTASVAWLQELIKQYVGAGVSFLITSHQEVVLPGLSARHLLIQDKTLIRP